jgi:hypothetical protein
MALNLTNINYSGSELAIDIVRQAFATSLIHTAYGARIIAGTKSLGVWHNSKISLTVNGGKPVCPTFDSDYLLNQNTVPVCAFHASGKIAHDALVGTYRERFLAEGTLAERTFQDTELQAALLGMLIEAVSEEQGINFLTADPVANPAKFCAPGLLLQFKDNTLANPVPASQLITPTNPGDAINPATVQIELSKVINTMPSKFRYGRVAPMKFAVSAPIMDAYLQSLTYTAPQAAAGAFGPNPDSASVFYRGLELVVVEGLGDEEMFLTDPDNVALIFDSDQDLFNAEIVDLQPTTLCAEVGWRIDWRAGVLFGDGEKVVFYSPTN